MLKVSIPYSSGQCFFFPPQQRGGGILLLSFNPLFIRSVFLFGWEEVFLAPYQLGFNPLFIRSVFLLKMVKKYECEQTVVFQSLIHQVSVSFRRKQMVKQVVCACFNPLFIRSVFLLRCKKNE